MKWQRPWPLDERVVLLKGELYSAKAKRVFKRKNLKAFLPEMAAKRKFLRIFFLNQGSGGHYWTRTSGIYLVRVALYQLS